MRPNWQKLVSFPENWALQQFSVLCVCVCACVCVCVCVCVFTALNGHSFWNIIIFTTAITSGIWPVLHYYVVYTLWSLLIIESFAELFENSYGGH